MMKNSPFVLRKLHGTFDACRAVGGLWPSGAPRAASGPGLGSALGAFCSALAGPFLALLAVVAIMIVAAHGAHHVAAHRTTLGLAGAGFVGETVDLKKAHDELQVTIKQLRDTLDASQAEQKKYSDERAETKQKIERMQAALDQYEVKMQRALTAARGGDREIEIRSEQEEKAAKAYLKYLRRGDESELKSLSTDSDPDGGYAAPPTFSARIINKLIQFSNVRGLATVETLSKGSELLVPAEGAQNFEVGWASERQSRDETASGQLRLERIPAEEMYAKPLISQNQLDDESIDLESWAGDRVARRLGVKEGTAFVNGTGIGQPEGFMVNDDVAVATSGNANLITTDGMFDLMALLPTPYAQQGTIVANRKTKYALRKLKDGQGRYLWEANLQAGLPAAFDGVPFIELVDMPDVAANAYPVAFGDFKSAYTIVDRQGIRMMRDPFSSKPFIELYTTKRTGGQVVLAEALVKLQIAA